MARNTLHYAAERKMFTNGILHTQLKEVRSTFVMLKQIMRHILRLLSIDKEAQRNLLDNVCSQQKMIDYFKDFFNCKQQESLKKTKHEQNEGKSEHLFLLCLDNVDEIIKNDLDDFTFFLQELYDNCATLRVLVTSRTDMGPLPN